MSQGEFLLYQAEDARTYIQVRFQEGGLWLTQQQLADLYQSTPQNITQHIRAIYETGELREEATCKPYLQVRQERGRGDKSKTSQYGAGRVVRGGGMMEHLRRFYLKFIQWLLEVNPDALRWKSVRPANSETACRNFGASLDALDIFHAERGKSWQTGILKAKGVA